LLGNGGALLGPQGRETAIEEHELQGSELEALAASVPHLSIDAILSHPRLPQARRVYVERHLALYGRDPFLTRLLVESGRFLVHKVALVLDAAQDPSRRETWLTLGRLKREMAMFGLTSARQIDYLVARLRAVEFLDSVVPEGDRRLRVLKPTEQMLAHDREWLLTLLAPLSVLSPHIDYGLSSRSDPALQVALGRMGLRVLPLSAKLLAANPDMLLFFNRAAGFMVITALVHAAMQDPDRPHAPVPFGEVGDRFGVSRTHVRSLMAAAQRAKLVRVRARGGHFVEILPRLWACYDRGMATGLFLQDLVHAVVTGRRSDS
jgi:hypothetical protein